jgi:hypothetical protein
VTHILHFAFAMLIQTTVFENCLCLRRHIEENFERQSVENIGLARSNRPNRMCVASLCI